MILFQSKALPENSKRQGSPMTIVQMEQLTRRYGKHIALKEVNLKIPKGSLFGFIGPNGAGKSTTIRVLLGLLRPNGGRATIFGLDCRRRSKEIKKRVGYLPGDLVLYSWMNGLDALKMLSPLRGPELGPRWKQLAAYFELDLKTRVRDMSRGMRQKLGLLFALAHDPELLILDEPTSALDPLTQERLYRELRRRAQKGHTVFFSSHILGEVADLCDRVAIIRKGEIVEDEELETLRARARRLLTLHWPSGATPEPPPFLEVIHRDALTWKCFLDEPAPALLEWLKDRAVTDMTLGPPDLDSLFRTYYKDEVTS